MQEGAFARNAGACRWLWNYLLSLQQKQHAEDGTFIFFHDMSKMLPSIKAEHEWLKEAPSNSLVRVCRNLDLALKKCFKEGTGFPRFKARGKSRSSFYVANHVFSLNVDRRKVVLPKIGAVSFRTGKLPEGRSVGANVAWTGRSWELTIQCEMNHDLPVVLPELETVIGVDLGLKELLVRSDGVRTKPPKSLRKALKRLRRAQRCLARRKKGSANRARQARQVGRIHAQVRDARRDAQHKATSSIVKAATAVATETLNVKGMIRNRRLSLTIADAGWGEVVRQIDYKCLWAGKQHIKAERFDPSTQTCSACRLVKTGDDKLRLHQRIFRCDCGLVMDRDDNSALNLRRTGLEAFGLISDEVGQAMPELSSRRNRRKTNACGETSGGRAASATLSHVAAKQEPARSSTELSG